METIFPNSQSSQIEIKVLKWGNVISGWKKRILFLDQTSIKIINSKTQLKKKNNIRKFSLLELKLYDEHKKKQFYLYSNGKKFHFKTESEEDKTLFLSKAKEFTFELIKKTNFTPIEYEKDNHRNVSDRFEISKNFFLNILNNMKTINKSLETLQDYERHFKHTKFRTEYIETLSKIIIVSSEVQKAIENSIVYENKRSNNIIDKNRKSTGKIPINSKFCLEDINKKGKDFLKENNKNIGNYYEEPSIIDQLESSSDDDKEKIEEIKTSREIINQSNINLKNFQEYINKGEFQYTDSKYDFNKRKELPNAIKCPENFIKGMLKSMTSKKCVMPICYNEPISMLQRQCEKFYYSELLNKAADQNIPSEIKICYIAGFICAEFSQNLGRFLKPFNPILGETFEYFDNEKKYRYFSEQVSHNPPISAYYCEGSQFVFFGDTRVKTSFKFLKGAFEIEYTNKTHLIFKDTNHSYIFTKPKSRVSGFINGNPKFDVEGKMIIQDVNNQDIYAEVNFKEDKSNGKKPQSEISLIEGTVYNGKNQIYKIKGNWKDAVYYTDIKGNNKNDIWEISNEKYLNNNLKNYYLPDCSLNLNYIDDELAKVLPQTDSRLRPDQRLLEMGNIEKAQEVKMELEDNQRKRHEKFEEDKIIYEPFYFNNVFNDKSDDFVYVYKGGYFEERKKGIYSNNQKIFEIKKVNLEEVSK